MGYEELCIIQYVYGGDEIYNDWRQWPAFNRENAEKAISRALAERPSSRIVDDESTCSRKHGMEGSPQELYRVIKLQLE